MALQSASQDEVIVTSSSIDDSFLSRSFEVGAERLRILIFDGLFEEKALVEVYRQFKSLNYCLGDYDREDTKTIRHLVHAFEPQEIEATSVVKAIIQGTRELAKAHALSITNVAKVYANFNLYGDYQFAHVDGDVWTALVFVNASWHEDWGGELLLYDGTPASTTTRGFAYAITPIPGRMVIFDGRIKHRGGVPSKYCLEPRISFAIKFSK